MKVDKILSVFYDTTQNKFTQLKFKIGSLTYSISDYLKFPNNKMKINIYYEHTLLKSATLSRDTLNYVVSNIYPTVRDFSYLYFYVDDFIRRLYPDIDMIVKQANKQEFDTGILYDNLNIDTEPISLVASHDYLKSYLLDIDTLVKLNNKEIDRQHANIKKAESTIKSIEKLNLALMKAKL